MKKFIFALLFIVLPSVAWADVIMGPDIRLDSVNNSIEYKQYSPPYEIIIPVSVLILIVGLVFFVSYYKKRK